MLGHVQHKREIRRAEPRKEFSRASDRADLSPPAPRASGVAISSGCLEVETTEDRSRIVAWVEERPAPVAARQVPKPTGGRAPAPDRTPTRCCSGRKERGACTRLVHAERVGKAGSGAKHTDFQDIP